MTTTTEQRTADVVEPGAKGRSGSRPPRRPSVRPQKGERPPVRPPVYYEPLPPERRFVRGVFQVLAILLLAFVLNIALLSHIQHGVAQVHLYAELRDQLAEGTLPVSEGDVDNVLLADGAPVALLDIPQIGVHEVIVEGSDSSTLMSGPGHRRDTVLPGQAGVSVILGRAAAYGGPFNRIQELSPGMTFTVLTGQGKQTFRAIDVRYAGDPTPPPMATGGSRLVLESARGPAYVPTGIVYVDADLVGTAQERGARQTTYASLPDADLAFGSDTSTLWALVFALQYLVAVEVAYFFTARRVGGRKLWVVFVPLLSIGGLWVSTQLVLLLPNVL